MQSLVPFSFFIEYDISTNDCLPSIWIVLLIAFQVGVLTNEKELLTLVIQLTSCLIRYMHTGYTSKNSQMRDVRLPSTPCFLWCLSLRTSCQRLNGQVHCICNYSYSKLLGQSLAFKYAPHHVKGVSILPFCYIILLEGSQNCQGQCILLAS